MNDTPTPETDAEVNEYVASATYNMVTADFARKLERERDEWKAKFIQQNKDLGCELRDPNGTIWDYSTTLQRESDELKQQLSNMTDQRDAALRIIEWMKKPEPPHSI